MTQKRTILLLGRTGNGKSTIANVISNTNRFAESELGVSQTRGIQEGTFRVRNEDIEYHIVDTIGIGDTRFDEKQVLVKLAEATNAIRNGLNQIFFVTSNRFTEEEIKAYTLLRTVFFAEDIGKYTTIIRTKFPTFRRAERCAADKEAMIRENADVAEIIQSCNRLIHVNNMTEDEDPELKTRAECRNILRHHLRFNCENLYRPKNLDEANERIGNYMTDREKTQKQINNLEEKIKNAEERAKKGDEAAIRAQEQYTNALKNLVDQQSSTGGKNSKLNGSTNEFEIKWNKRKLWNSNWSLKETIKNQAKFYDRQNTKQTDIYKAQIEELNKRNPEVHNHYHLCEIM